LIPRVKKIITTTTTTTTIIIIIIQTFIMSSVSTLKAEYEAPAIAG